MAKPKGKQESTGLWESILREVHTESRMPDKTLLLLGRAGIGKRTLCQALLTHSCPAAAESAPDFCERSRAVGLDFAYIGARDPEVDEAASAPDFICPAACSAYILEDVRHEKLLRCRVAADRLKHCAVVICLDLKRPWTMMEDLRQWLEMVQRITADLLTTLTLAEQDDLRARVAEAVSGYREPGAAQPAAEGETKDHSAPLVYNMGIPLVVVVTRADGAAAFESQKTAGWSQAIEAYLRSECLQYGAAIVYTTIQSKHTTNVDVLYEYLMHRLYGYALRRKALVPSRDSLFVPSGWDDQQKVDAAGAQLPDGGGLDRAFESVIVNLDPPPAAAPPQEECEDMQTFLARSAAILQKIAGVTTSDPRKVKDREPSVPGGAAVKLTLPHSANWMADLEAQLAAAGFGAQEDRRRLVVTDCSGAKVDLFSGPSPLALGAEFFPLTVKREEAAGPLSSGGPPSAPRRSSQETTKNDTSSLHDFFQNLLTLRKDAPAGGAPAVGTPASGAAAAAGTAAGGASASPPARPALAAPARAVPP